MWQTPIGTRILQGAEADLFRVAAGMFQDGVLGIIEMEDDPGSDTGPDADRFARLPWYQQICAVGEVARHLLDYTDDPEPPLWAWNELTIYTVYDCFMHVARKSDARYVLRAAREVGLTNKKRITSKSEFKDLTGRMLHRILNNRDFTQADVERVREKGMKALGLREDYWGALFPAFTMERFLASITLLNEDWAETASALLPPACRARFEHGIDETIEIPEDLAWHPY
jgi:hypothetical protein